MLFRLSVFLLVLFFARVLSVEHSMLEWKKSASWKSRPERKEAGWLEAVSLGSASYSLSHHYSSHGLWVMGGVVLVSALFHWRGIPWIWHNYIGRHFRR